MRTINNYLVKQYKNSGRIEVNVPGSKSITNRALMIAALSAGVCKLKGVLFSDDSRAFLSCLTELGFEVTINEEIKEVTIHGLSGQIPNRNAKINVRSAGTAARFLIPAMWTIWMPTIRASKMHRKKATLKKHTL